MAENMRLYLELMGRSGNLRSELRGTQGAVRSWSSAVKREFQSLRNAAGSLQGQLATLGIGFSVARVVSDSAKMDKALVRTKQTAGMTAREMALLRKELWAMSRKTGQPVEELKEGFDGLVASGMKFQSALETIKAIDIGSAVTGAKSNTLGGGLTVGATAFNFDLSKPGLALELLDKMTVAGRQGNAELESLSDIFSRVGVNAASAGMGFEQTLAFIEGLSLIERQPERLATLADSTLRLFTNLKYMKSAQKATGIRFFDSKGERRDALSIIGDIKKKYDKLTTDKQRADFIQKAFGETDLDTQKGMKTFLDGTALGKVEEFTRELSTASGTLKRDFGEATSNLVDQANMLKNDLKEAADNFVQPMNKTLADWIKWARESKEGGGAGIDGETILKKDIPVGIGAALLARYGIKAGRRIFSGGASLAGGVAGGKALEEVTGVQPVFVVNMPDGFGRKIGSATIGAGAGAGAASAGRLTSVLRSAGSAATRFGPYALMASMSGGAGYMVGNAINRIMGSLSGGLSHGKYGGEGWLGSLLFDMVQADREKYIKNDINLNISIDQNGRVTTSSSDPNAKASINTMNRGFFGAVGDAAGQGTP